MSAENDTPPMPLAAGSTYAGRYKLKRRLGIGRLGEVWLAEDTRLEMEVAVKFFDAVENRRFLESAARKCMKIIHPHIVRIYDYLDEDGRCALVMEYLEGGSLTRRLKDKEEGCYEAHEIQPWVRQLWSALADLHEQKLDHGNLNLSNLGIAATGELKIMEAGFFNIRAIALNPEQTFSYLPCLTPQLLDDGQPGPEDDCYAAAACVYELLTGRPVFLGSANLPAQIRTQSPPPVAVRRAEIGVGQEAVPEAWEVWIAQSLSKNAAARPTAATLRDRLRRERTLGAAGTTSREAAAPVQEMAAITTARSGGVATTRLPAMARSLPRQAWIGIGVAAALLIFALASWLPARRALQEMEDAFAAIRLKNGAEPPATMAALWADFQKRYDAPIPYTRVDSELLADAADFQFTMQEAADAEERARKLAEERAERERRDRQNKVVSAVAEMVEKARQEFDEKANAAENIDGWKQTLQSLINKAATLGSEEDLPVAVKQAKKDIEAEIARWTEEHETEMKLVSNALGRMNEAVESLKPLLQDAALPALAKKLQVEKVQAQFAGLADGVRQNQGVAALLTQLQGMQQQYATEATTATPLDIRALFADTSYAGLTEAQLGSLLKKVYAGFNIDPAADPDRRQLQQAILSAQMKEDPARITGRLTPAQLQAVSIPLQMTPEELSALTPKEAQAVVKSATRRVKKVVEEEKPGFWRGMTNKAKGLFTGGKDEKK